MSQFRAASASKLKDRELRDYESGILSHNVIVSGTIMGQKRAYFQVLDEFRCASVA